MPSRHRDQKSRTFFCREILKTKKISGRKLEIAKNVGAKVENPKNFPVEI